MSVVAECNRVPVTTFGLRESALAHDVLNGKVEERAMKTTCTKLIGLVLGMVMVALMLTGCEEVREHQRHEYWEHHPGYEQGPYPGYGHY